jgi:hypothetical protein
MKVALAGHFGGVRAEVSAAVTVFPSFKDGPVSKLPWSAEVTRRWGEDEVRTSETEGYVKELKEPASKAVRAGASKSVRPVVPRPPEVAPKNGSPFEEDARREPGGAPMAALALELGSARKLRLDVEMLAAPSYSKEERPCLATDGTGLASVLADLAGRSPHVLQAIHDAAREVLPALEGIRTRRVEMHEPEAQAILINGSPVSHTVSRSYWGHQLVLDFKGAPDIPAPLASEGTLLVLGLLTALLTDPQPRLLLLDDIDKALHPRAQEELCKQLRKVLDLDPELQILATSHSPYMLDHFDPAEVLVTALRPDGSTGCAVLADHPDFDRWKRTTRAGELWSFLGEDWIVQPPSTKRRRR